MKLIVRSSGLVGAAAAGPHGPPGFRPASDTRGGRAWRRPRREVHERQEDHAADWHCRAAFEPDEMRGADAQGRIRSRSTVASTGPRDPAAFPNWL